MTGAVNSTPLVSVVIPTYNRVAFLAEAISSVLAQTFADYEVIVVDDGSTDRTATMIQGFGDPRVQFLAFPHSGLVARMRNAGIERARGRYVAFLDSDDLWDSTKLDDQFAALSDRPECRWSHTGGRCIDDAGASHARWPEPRFALQGWIGELLLRRRAPVNTSSVLAERAFLREVGGFDETFVWGEDYDLWVRLALRSPVAGVRDPRVRRRMHADQLSGRGWERPVLRTLGRTARSATSWRVRSLCLREAGKVGALYAMRRARSLVGRFLRGRTDPDPAGAVDNRLGAD